MAREQRFSYKVANGLWGGRGLGESGGPGMGEGGSDFGRFSNDLLLGVMMHSSLVDRWLVKLPLLNQLIDLFDFLGVKFGGGGVLEGGGFK